MRRPRGSRGYSALVGLTIGLSAALTGCRELAPPPAPEGRSKIDRTARAQFLVPLYAYPSWYAPETYLWQRIAAAARRVPMVAVVNPANGPGSASDPANPDYVRGITALRRAGATVLGYVPTGWGTRDITAVLADIDLHYERYRVDGIFLDEASGSAAQLAYYARLHAHVKSRHDPGALILNQGARVDERYVSQPAADVVVLFEGAAAAWERHEVDAYVSRYPDHQFACLVHGVKGVEAMRRQVDKAVRANVHFIYVTDDSPAASDRNPWNSLPSYWDEEVALLEELNRAHGGAPAPAAP